jgi:hypothetical protein
MEDRVDFNKSPSEIHVTAPDPSWPSQGMIEFHHYSTKYRPELPQVVSDISFSETIGKEWYCRKNRCWKVFKP